MDSWTVELSAIIGNNYSRNSVGVGNIPISFQVPLSQTGETG